MSEPTMTKFEPTLISLRETADRLDEIMEVSSPWVHAKLTPMLRDVADVIEWLEHENAKLWKVVDESDEELYLDIAQGLFDDLMAVDGGKAKLWARAWPELFGKRREDVCSLV